MTSWDLKVAYETYANYEMTRFFLIAREENDWPVSACLCCPVAASLCVCKHGLPTS